MDNNGITYLYNKKFQYNEIKNYFKKNGFNYSRSIADGMVYYFHFMNNLVQINDNCYCKVHIYITDSDFNDISFDYVEEFAISMIDLVNFFSIATKEDIKKCKELKKNK